jgi:tRNA 2-thiouridine synthesizing protein A
MYDPLPIFHLRTTLAQMNSGEIIELISNDPAAKSDMAAWSKLTGHNLLETHSYEDHDCFLIQKKS